MPETLTARETFMALLDHGPLLEGDAIVVLCGEDAQPRLAVAVGLFMGSRSRPRVVFTGGVDDGKRWAGAERMMAAAMGAGIAPDLVMVDTEASNTREQAESVVVMAQKEGWRRVQIVASAYHVYRAFLTFVQALKDAGADESLQITPAPVSHTPWFGTPAGMDMTRADLLAGEFEKIEAYAGDVASYADGIEYLRFWEGK